MRDVEFPLAGWFKALWLVAIVCSVIVTIAFTALIVMLFVVAMHALATAH